MNFQMLSNQFGGYSNFYRRTYRGVKGYVYDMGRKLTENEKKEILSYQNTAIGGIDYPYAPELSRNGVFIGDKCF